MQRPELPERYYLDHFTELIDFLDKGSRPLMEESHLGFLMDFRALSEEAQCCYIRMLNRKNYIFHRDEFGKYKEIKDPSSALEELASENFLRALLPEDRSELINGLTKAELTKWLGSAGVQVAKSAARDQLLEHAIENLEALQLEALPHFDGLIRQGRIEDLDYLLFLYFGQITKSLTLYTLRDLGIRGTNKRVDFRPRFPSLQEAKLEYRFRRFAEELPSLETIEATQSYLLELGPRVGLSPSVARVRDEILLAQAQSLEFDHPEQALILYRSADLPPSRERQVRILWKLNQRSQARLLLEEILAQPFSDDEILFAEDFVARKFESKKLGALTEKLRNAPELVLSDAFRTKPEVGVCEHFQDMGYKTHFVENEIWCALFGLIFWDELFESENSAIFNPFERSPVDLIDEAFYESHKDKIEAKLADLKNPAKTQLRILNTVAKHHGELNDLFRWSPDLTQLVQEFIKAAKEKNLALVLRKMAQNFATYHSGFPDLLLMKDGELEFVEVKAEGDSLRSKQLSKLKLIEDAGFKVSLLRVRWQTDPDQIYVVVDVETTGGSPVFNRITEIGAVKIQNGEIIEEFQTLINPGRPIPANITQITGITNEMVADAPSFAEVAEDFLKFCHKGIFVAHNARFDYSFFQKEYSRLEQNFVRPLICTCSGMKKAYPGLESYSLKNLTQHFEIPLESHHRALHDAKAAAGLLILMNSRRQNLDSGRMSDTVQ